MSMFTVRIELHEASWQNYVALANDLATKGITDVVTGDNGLDYKMPPAEYNYVGGATLDAVFSAAQASAIKTGRRHAVLVSEASARKWIGLDVVQARRSA